MRGPAPARLLLEEFLPYQLSLASNAVSRVIARAYQDGFGLSIPEWRLIAVMRNAPAASQQDLVERTLMDKVAVSRAARALERRGLIARTEDPSDRRAWRLSLTDIGTAMFEAIEPLALELEARLLEGFSPSERAALSGLLARLRTMAH